MSDAQREFALPAYPLASEDCEALAERLHDEVTLLFAQLRRPLLRYLLALGLPVHEGEEIVQEVFLALFRHLEAHKPRPNLRAWVFRVGHNLGLRQRYSQRENLCLSLEPQEWDMRQADPSPNPEEQAQQNQRRRRLRSVLRALPEQDQWCLCLRAEGFRYREIADILGMSLGAVSLSLTRSVTRLNRADKA
jgi:RNA polymerase sigma-70 factor (ECF subfamily)